MDTMPNVHFNKNEVIFEEGYPADSVYLVCEGSVQVFKKRQNTQFHLATLGKGSIFGEMAFISSRPRSATVISSDNTWCYSLNKSTFEHKLKNLDPSIKNIFDDLVETVRKKSEAALVVDHGRVIEEPLDELVALENKTSDFEIISPSYSYEYLKKDKELIRKVENMDFFMRALYSSLVNIACK